jgi:hypothetical protein
MEIIKEKIEYSIARERKILEYFYTQKEFEDWYLSSLSSINSDLAFFYLIEGNPGLMKNYLSIVGYIDIYLTRNYTKSHSRFLDYDLPRCLKPILSDNGDLISKYSSIRYSTFYKEGNYEELKPLTMDEMVALGESPVWCNTVQFFMANDFVGVERNLNIIETITLKSLPKNEEGLKDDYEFYKALHNSDKARMEEVLEKLTSPKIHKKRNDNPLLNQYISFPALGYAKLAWRKGIEVEVNSKLVPIELLPVQPLDKYEIPYEFLQCV